MEVAESILPGALKRTLDAFDKQQSHDHKVDESIIELHRVSQTQEKSDSWKAFAVILVFGGVLAYLLILGKPAEASIFGGFFITLAALARAMRKKA
jgi:uncharacterized membrane protein